MRVEEKVLNSPSGRPFSIDMRSNESSSDQSIIIFVHGFKGFKDAMHFNAIANTMANADFTFIKMNFSHNGTTPNHPTDFVDLEAFSENNFTKELQDIDATINYIQSDNFPFEANKSNIYLIGHSRGGGITFIKTADDDRIKKAVTWAAVPDFHKMWSMDRLEKWKKEGITHVANSRTFQQMPMKFQLVQDYIDNQAKYDIPSRLKTCPKPILAIHGANDETVPVASLELLKAANNQIETIVIKEAGHTFGGRHPWKETILPRETQKLLKHTIDFLRR